MPLITACIICKNEEKYIESCIRALQEYQIPVVVTDTGSTDQTIPIIKSLLTPRDKLCHFVWCDDFSAAKNYCVSKAPSDWIWLIDADEILRTYDFDVIRQFVSQPDNKDKIGVISRKDAFSLQGEKTFATTKSGRIYNRLFYHYEGIIHEQLTPSYKCDFAAGVATDPAGISSANYVDLPALFDHMGYVTPEILKQKCMRNIALLKKEYAQKKDPYLSYQLGSAYATLEDYESAILFFEEGLSFDLEPKLQYVKDMVTSYGYSLLAIERYEQALSFTGIYDAFSDTADFVFLMGLIYMNNAMFDRAIAEFEKATTFSTCDVDGVNSYRAYYNKGVILECTGQIPSAICAYRKCGDFEPALSRIQALSTETRITEK